MMTATARPFFSVIVPTFNRVDMLPRAVASVLAQEFADLELLIVDDGSTDDTPAVLAALDDPRVRVLRQANGGVSSARNLGLSRARGEAVTFLDSDDESHPEWLSVFAAVLKDPRVGIATAGARVIHRTQDGTKLDADLLLPQPLGPVYCHQRISYTAGTLATRRKLLLSISGYAEAVRFAENAEMAMRLVPACLERGLEVVAVHRPLVIYHRDASAWSAGRAAFESMRAGAEYILDHHGDRILELSPGSYANYRGVAAVNAARLSDMRAARRHLLAAIRAEPLRWQSYLRLALAVVPPLAKRYWTRHGADGSNAGAGT